MRWVYLSPHFDDAVLSCGGLIWEQARQGLPVEIWTILAGEPPAGSLSEFAAATHKLWGDLDASEVLAVRKMEDETAASIVGADLVRFDIPDCIYRRSPQGQPLYTQTVFAAPHPAEADLPAQIAAALGSELAEEDMLVCPLALGSHVDHLLVRKAAELLQRPLHYYVDIPYLFNNAALLSPAVASMEAGHFDISEAGLKAWLEGIGAYKSQLKSLYKDEGALFAAIQDYWAAQHGLSLWHLR